MRIIKFFHKLFKPNCSCTICISPRCEMCEELKIILEGERLNNRRLVEALTSERVALAETTTPTPLEEYKPIGGVASWDARRRQLEARDRAEAEKRRLQLEEDRKSNELRAKLAPVVVKDSIEKLEKELGVVDENTVGEANASEESKAI